VANDPRINDLCEALTTLAGAISELASAFTDDPVRGARVVGARRMAQEAERIAERVLVNP
jgi:hypothetical protein